MDALLEATAQAEERHFWFRGLRRNAATLLDRALGGRRDLRLVDCGAGSGRNLDWLKQYGTVVGIELSPTGIRVGRAAGRNLVRGSVARLPIADGWADVATSFDVLYCLDTADETAAVREMWRVLAPGGLALFNVAALDILHGAHSVLSGERRRYSPSRLRTLLGGQGFSIERLTFTNLPTLPVTLAKRLFDRVTGQAAQASTADLRVPPGPINALFDAALGVENALLARFDMPVGTSLICLARKPADQ